MKTKAKQKDTLAGDAEGRAVSWLLLVFNLPANPSNARVRTWRRLQAVGAVGLKNSAYVLPDTAQAREDFEWIAAEIAGLKGHANILRAEALDAALEREIVGSFQSAREADYKGIAQEGARLFKSLAAGRATAPTFHRARRAARTLRERFGDVVAADFFGSSGRREVEALLLRIERALARQALPARKIIEDGEKLMPDNFQSKTWVTRPRPGVDRMACAWLIRNFIDAKSRYIFADKPGDAPHAIPFDMFAVRFGHQGSACTFETLVTNFRIRNAAVERIGRIVHDIDLKDTQYQLPEEAAIGRLVEGLRQVYAEDHELLAHGMEMFEALYRSFSTNPQGAKSGTRKNATKRGGSFLGLA
jgi:hypothetical protein